MTETSKTIHRDFERYAITHPMYGYIPQSRKYVMDTYIKPGMKVLDAGCGDGQHLEYLATLLPRQDLFGTEISQIRVDRVSKKGFTCAKVDGPRLPFSDRSFDAVVFFEVIEHIPETDVDLLLREIARVLKPNGVVVGSTPNYPIKRYYDFSGRIRSRLRRIPAMMNTGRPSPPISRNGCANEPAERLVSDTASRQPWLIRQVSRLFADDPTHQFFCSFDLIHRLGKQHFQEVELFTTFKAMVKRIPVSSPTKFFSHKIIFVFKQ